MLGGGPTNEDRGIGLHSCSAGSWALGTGYIGGTAAEALLARGHHVLALARSQRSADTLTSRGLEPVDGDFSQPANLHAAIAATRPDALVSTASVGGSLGDTAATFARDRDAVRAMQGALADYGER